MEYKIVYVKPALAFETLVVADVINSLDKEQVKINYIQHVEPNLKEADNVILYKDSKIIAKRVSDITRYFARTIENAKLYGDVPCPRTKTEVDQWLSFAMMLDDCSFASINNDILAFMNKVLHTQTYLVNKNLTLGDIHMFGALLRMKYMDIKADKETNYVNVTRWYKYMKCLFKNVIQICDNDPEKESVQTKENSIEKQVNLQSAKQQSKSENADVDNSRKQEGKFIELPEAEMGKVVVRFPPEASGYLHIGHAKAALLNQYYAEVYQGKLIMRFDDTNPAKEDAHFEDAILEDIKLMEITPYKFTFTSDYFDVLKDFCTALLMKGLAYVDDTPADIMKEQRDQKLKSKNRDNPIEQNRALWEEMQRDTEKGQQCCVRAKIDYESPNGCMRDPTIYRCKSEPHPRTGSKFKVYPTYDFACPIVDSIEGVTHALRTTEYHDRDVQYCWILEALQLRCPVVWEYSRLNMANTVLSKRKLTWFVNERLVDGWDDPRLPTVRGIVRRGLTLPALKQFITAQGSSRTVVAMEWDKIWAFNKKVIDPIATRYTALESNKLVEVTIKNPWPEQWIDVQKHPKDPSKGTKKLRVGSDTLLIERADAESFVVGQNATFINWGNFRITAVDLENDKVEAELNLDDKNFKNTVKVTWLIKPKDACKNKEALCTNPINCYAVYFDHIINTANMGKDADFKDFVNRNTRKEVPLLGEVVLKDVRKGEIIQLQRKGFFICDVPHEEVSPYSSRVQPVVLFHIPDGHATTVASNNPVEQKTNTPNAKVSTDKAEEISREIKRQGDKVRDLKSTKADKNLIDEQVKILLELKKDYKTATGQEWKPQTAVSTGETGGKNRSKVVEISKEIKKQGDKVRNLKSSKADKSVIDKEVQILLQLKKDYKAASGQEWNPQAVTSTGETDKKSASEAEKISGDIKQQGDKVRNLKSSKADKNIIDKEVQILLQLKKDYKAASGQEWNLQAVTSTGETDKKSASEAEKISGDIKQQGDKVRNLKSSKADKNIIDKEVQILLQLKKDYKAASGQEWNPQAATSTGETDKKSASEAEKISGDIKQQGDKVRNLKSSKADKSIIDKEVQILLQLKKDYKAASGQEWNPQAATSTGETDKKSASEAEKISGDIKQQGDKVRNLKSSKADKSIIDKEVQILLQLKKNYKAASGQEWNPQAVTSTGETDKKSVSEAEKISRDIKQQGDKVRNLKSSKADKSIIDKEVQILLELKKNYKSATGQEWKPQAAVSTDEADGKKAAISCTSRPNSKSDCKTATESKTATGKKPTDASKKATDTTADTNKTGTRLGLEAKKEENFFEWYSQVITKSGMIEYYDVSGCYVLRPWTFSIWRIIRDYINETIIALGVEECYFPMFVTRGALEREKEHVSDFAPEVAWVTKCGDSDLAEPIAIRPTSETVMYPAYAKWLRSDTELPLKLNQWNNVVRWEFKDPKPFLRTREFLWQEGHTAFATKSEAEEEVLTILDMYARVYEDLLAVPVIKGRKTEKEKFAGGDYTTTVEAFISTSGRAIQGATSHHLGQNFSKMFNIQIEGAVEGEKTFVYQNSWGLTTRTIGVMIMVHGDDKGLVLPPRVAGVQAVVVPCGITATMSEEKKAVLLKECKDLFDTLKSKFRVKADFRSNRTPGWKFNHWELKGVPVRIELGPKDLERDEVTFVRRYDSGRIVVKRHEVVQQLDKLLDEIQSYLLNRARDDLNGHVKQIEHWSNFCSELEKKNLLLTPFCGESACEDKIKADSARDNISDEPGALAMGAKSLCIPFDQPKPQKEIEKLDCIYHGCKNKAKFYTLFGRSY